MSTASRSGPRTADGGEQRCSEAQDVAGTTLLQLGLASGLGHADQAGGCGEVCAIRTRRAGLDARYAHANKHDHCGERPAKRNVRPLLAIRCIAPTRHWSPSARLHAGDSTASEYAPKRPRRMGMRCELHRPAWQVTIRHAPSSRSFPSRVSRRDWRELRARRAADSSCHNDEKHEDPRATPSPNRVPDLDDGYVTVERERGATPILLTPLARRVRQGQLWTRWPYEQATRDLRSAKASA